MRLLGIAFFEGYAIIYTEVADCPLPTQTGGFLGTDQHDQDPWPSLGHGSHEPLALRQVLRVRALPVRNSSPRSRPWDQCDDVPFVSHLLGSYRTL